MVAGDTYCEACGHALGAPTCSFCAAKAVDVEGYCERCGLRQPTGRDHAEIVLAGGAAAVTDRGLRRGRNEDAVALLETGGRTSDQPGGQPGDPTGNLSGGATGSPIGGPTGGTVVTVVCDGVGSSPRADEASAVAVETAGAALARGLSQEEAFELAGRAVAKLATSVDDAPACTYVSAAVAPDGRVTLGWAGDTRAYLLPGGDLLTEDDVVETGEITAWLGADAGDVDLHLRAFTPQRPGLLLVCSDGLWRYLDGYAFPATGTPIEMAREMLRHALDSGGQDNVTIVLIPLGESHG